MSRRLFDTIRKLLGRGMTQSEVDAINLALEQGCEQLAREAGTVSHRKLEDAGAFFDRVRDVTGPLSQARVDSVNLILNHASACSIAWTAYILATAWHESRFEPQAEWGKGKGKRYGVPGKYGQAPYGRGFVQLTWDFNYEWADQALGLNGALLRNFDLALAPHIAARILVKGMVEGKFTGKALGDYLGVQATKEQFRQARRIVNGRDKENEIAAYAVGFQEALIAGRWR